jgi:hypothetical protein
MLIVDTESSLHQATEILDILGIPVKDSDGNYRGINEILTDLSCVWSQIGDESKINIFAKLLTEFPSYVEKSSTDIGNSFKSVFQKLNKN